MRSPALDTDRVGPGPDQPLSSCETKPGKPPFRACVLTLTWREKTARHSTWQIHVIFIQENVSEPSRRKESETITRAATPISPSQLVCPIYLLPPTACFYGPCLLPWTSACPRLWPVLSLTLSGFLVQQLRADSVSLCSWEKKTKLATAGDQTVIPVPAGHRWK